MTTNIILDPIIRRDAIEFLEDNFDHAEYHTRLANASDADLKDLIGMYYPNGFKAFCAATWASVEAAEAEARNIF